jgi:hypothetical protein
MHKLLNSVCNKEELPGWLSLLLYKFTKKGNKTDCNNFHRISLLSISFKILSNILLSSFKSIYIGETMGDHQCGFRRNRSTTDKIFCIHQILEKKLEYNETLDRLFIRPQEGL